MNLTDQALLASASLKIKRAESWTLSDVEREAYAFYFGARALAEALTIKADPPPKLPRVQGMTRQELRQALKGSIKGMLTALLPELKQALDARDVRIAQLETQLAQVQAGHERRLVELEADVAVRRELTP